MAGCIFCGIVNRELDSDVVHDSGEVLAFRDVNPAAPVHVLVVPKRHVESAAELSAEHGELLGEMFETIGAIAHKEGIGDGYRVVTNVGADAGQSVQHLHFHVIGGRSMSWPPG